MSNHCHFIERRQKHSRMVNHYEPRLRLLIVCEGEKTEPNYFKRFPIPRDSIVEVIGVGANTVSLVREAIRRKSENKYDQVWCVFDKDSFPNNNFNSAFLVASANNIHIAYSNEAFELWYILHFEYLNTALTRKGYIKRLNKLLGHPYSKNSETIYKELYVRLKDAIRNAKNLISVYDIPDPANNNPSTTVHLLVEQLNRFFWEE